MPSAYFWLTLYIFFVMFNFGCSRRGAIIKIDFLGIYLCGFRGGGTQKFPETKPCFFLDNFAQKLDCVVLPCRTYQKSVQCLGRKKTHRGQTQSGVGTDERIFEIIFLYKYYRVKYFRPYYTPFVNENIFFAKRSRRI